MDSETDLLEAIKAFMSAGSLAHLYSQLLDLGFVKTLTDILSHENSDIVIEGINLLNELLEEGDEDDDERTDAVNKGMIALAKAVANSTILELVTQQLSKLDEGKADDREAVYQILSNTARLL